MAGRPEPIASTGRRRRRPRRSRRPRPRPPGRACGLGGAARTVRDRAGGLVRRVRIQRARSSGRPLVSSNRVLVGGGQPGLRWPVRCGPARATAAGQPAHRAGGPAPPAVPRRTGRSSGNGRPGPSPARVASTRSTAAGSSGAPSGSARRWRVKLRVHQGQALIRPERRRAAEQLERGAGQRVEVGPAVEGASLDLLGREVVERFRVNWSAAMTWPGGKALAHPEVGEVRVVGLTVADPPGRTSVRRVSWHRDRMLRGLDVAMDQAVRVRRIQRRRDLGDDAPGVADGSGPSR